ncbi:MAG: SDR family oxidoreductase [Myxococcota bacterium]
MGETVFFTGATGYLGSYALAHFLRETDDRVLALTRAKSDDEGREKLWKALQLHMEPAEFWALVDRVEVVPGDLTAPGLGLGERWDDVASLRDSILHVAASLNRKSAKACLNHNLRGTLAVLKLARTAQERGGLRRFSFVSTSAIAGKRDGATLKEEDALDWDLSDYDPYGRTKKFCEHMVTELLPDVPVSLFRPSTVMGDTRFPMTTQFDMVRAFNTVFQLPAFPIRPNARVDIVNANWVGEALFRLHRDPAGAGETYHLSAGRHSAEAHDIALAMKAHAGWRVPRMVPGLYPMTESAFDFAASMPQRNAITYVASLFKVFLPYITYDTVFDSTKAAEAIGKEPTSFLEYGPPFAVWAEDQKYRYPHRPLPPRPARVAVNEVTP